MAADEGTLLELEANMLTLWDQAWQAYEEQGAGYPPMALVTLAEKLHKMISTRLKSKIGPTFDTENPEAALIQLDRMREMILRQIEQRQRLRGLA